MLLSDYVNDVQEIIHDTSASVWPLSRVISRINEARLDVARDTHMVRQNVVGVQLLQGKEIYNLTGAIAGVTVTSGGSNYIGNTVPVVIGAPPPGGTQALAFGTVTNGAVTSITMTQWGAGYNYVPGVTVLGIGTGATAVAVPLFRANPLSTTVGQPITTVGISYIWNGERRSMKYLNFTKFQAYARLWVQNFLAPPGVWTEYGVGGNNPGLNQHQFYIQPPPDQLYVAELDMIFMPAPLSALTDFDQDLSDPWSRMPQWRASANLLHKLRNLQMVAEQESFYDKMVPRVITTTAGYRIPNPYNRSWARSVMR